MSNKFATQSKHCGGVVLHCSAQKPSILLEEYETRPDHNRLSFCHGAEFMPPPHHPPDTSQSLLYSTRVLHWTCLAGYIHVKSTTISSNNKLPTRWWWTRRRPLYSASTDHHHSHRHHHDPRSAALAVGEFIFAFGTICSLCTVGCVPVANRLVSCLMPATIIISSTT